MDTLNQVFQSRAAEMWVALALLVLVMEIWVLMVHRRVERLQDTLAAKLAEAPSSPAEDHEAILRLQESLPLTLQKVGLVRFNPFDDVGGDLSFALTLADANGNGVVLSSLHRRDTNKVYAKPLAQWQSDYTLSDEEQQAIGFARGDQPEIAPPAPAVSLSNAPAEEPIEG
ncbi:MAG: DUF4446 family protein [Chloroflexi bacterium]|nr:DUF4446 family protein [Chloroflexota bacterium]